MRELIETNDVYKDFFINRYMFDFYGYSENSAFYNKTNTKVVGKIKDEMKGPPIF